MAKKTPRLRLVDTTFRDAQQSLLGGHLRGDEIVPIAAKMDSIGFTAMEAFGGATFETQVRRRENPWEYLRNLDKATPNTPIQALIRGQNLLANRNFADDVVELFIKHAAKCGVDVFRVFDPLNDLRNMEATVGAALKAKKKVQGALSYAISPAHNIELWCSLAKGLVNMGCHEVVIKDTSGLLSPQATWELVTALKATVNVPIDVHSHCSSGMAPMAYMASVEAGAEILDVAMSPLAWGTSQPAVESVVAALRGGEYDTGLDLAKMWDAQHDLEVLKAKHIDDLSPVADRVDASILRYQMPGLMLEDVHRQLAERNASGRQAEVLEEANRVRKELGYPPLVAPIRQMIATQAVYNVMGGDRYATVTQELKDYLQGLYGRPPVPADHELRRLVLGREEPITIRPADLLEPQVEAARMQLKKMSYEPTDESVLIYLLFPSLTPDYLRGPEPVAKPPRAPAKITSEAPAAEPDPPAAPPPPPAAATAAEFDVEVEGEVFKVRVSGSGMTVIPGAAAGAVPAAAAPPGPPRTGEGTVIAPMQGLIVKLPVKAGDDVKLGDVVAVLEAMKMQNDIVTTVAGKVREVYVKEGQVVTPSQPLLAVG
ncbi:MAG TPA: pyruvate carboxylase subunit B [Candidatus Acidoferrum sp.]|jgi:pyruvate carboxylase subunit B|nr:pyruvate carboxylase subunit B [Candidatus Acidoferrum sp.]